MQDKYARLITTINSARSQMYKLAKGEEDDELDLSYQAPEGSGFEKLAPNNGGTMAGSMDSTSMAVLPEDQPNSAKSKAIIKSRKALADMKGMYDKGLAYLKDNPEQAIAAGAGALGMGAGAYLLAKLLKKKRAWMYGLGGALAGGAAGALGGKQAYEAIKAWLDNRRMVRKIGPGLQNAMGFGANVPDYLKRKQKSNAEQQSSLKALNPAQVATQLLRQ